jgi:hypothetical protein
MKKIFRIGLTAILAGGLLCGAASAEPATPDSGDTQVEMALLGPDRQPRAPQRAVKAPVRRTETRRTQVATPPPPPVKPFVYKKRECKTLTEVPYDLQGEEFFCYQNRPAFFYFDDGGVRMWTPDGRFPINKLGAMGADREFMRLEFAERMGVWANGRIADESPRAIVSAMQSRIKEMVCGTWSGPKATNIAGVPVTMSTGFDEHGNHWYEIISWERFGNTYAIATRVPYNTRLNTERNTENAWIVTHMHPTSWAE